MRRSVVIGYLLSATAITAAWYLVPDARTDRETALFYESDFQSVPDGTLIRAEGDEEVYFAIDGRKRWIDSLSTLTAHGFRSEDVRVISRTELNRYPDGEPITAQTRLVLPREEKVLPDLAPLAPYDLRLSTVAGRTVIRFTGSFWNKGYRAFRLLSDNQSLSGQAGTEDVYQHVEAEDGSLRKKFVGTFVWHPAHNHHHYGEFAEYLFEPAGFVPGTKLGESSTRQKTSFCIRDDERMPADIPGVPAASVYTSCTTGTQGVSPGWIDVYSYWLPDQYVDVHDAPPGVYALSFLVDPSRKFIEERDDNNIATTLVELDVRAGRMRVIASLSPFSTLRNGISDSTLLRDASNGDVYVVSGGRKRWLRSEDVLTSYGYSWSSVYPVTRAMIDAIPSQRLIRRQGTADVFIVNEKGFIRHLLNPAAFGAYGFTAEDIADINEADFASYPFSELIVLPGDAEVYRIDGTTKRSVGTLEHLQIAGHDLRGLHVVNQTDFDAYTTR
jgi:hypothetical protein